MRRKNNIAGISGILILLLGAVGSFYHLNIEKKENTFIAAACMRENKNEREGKKITVAPAHDSQGVAKISMVEEIPITTQAPKEESIYNAQRKLKISEKDYKVLLRIVEAEATGGSEKSKRMVANVVLNRVASNRFPNTVQEVVFQRGTDGIAQFSPISDGRYYQVTVTKETKKAVKDVVNGKDETSGALFFLNRKTASFSSLCWFENSLKYLFDCGGHSYYCYREF